MCGIVGYVGPKQASPILIDGLRRMEYRGYDSAGVAVLNGAGIKVKKAAGKLSALVEKLRTETPHGTVGIGHTRWATHGAPTTPNAHPHLDQSGKIAVIHNGIIENAPVIKKALEKRGHTFTSETDTEVLAHLVEAAFDGNLEEAVIDALALVEGTYGIAVISSMDPD
jgi:glucosamine--fructose-6-phosphate aminotransferase (isomerizing)